MEDVEGAIWCGCWELENPLALGLKIFGKFWEAFWQAIFCSIRRHILVIGLIPSFGALDMASPPSIGLARWSRYFT